MMKYGINGASVMLANNNMIKGTIEIIKGGVNSG